MQRALSPENCAARIAQRATRWSILSPFSLTRTEAKPVPVLRLILIVDALKKRYRYALPPGMRSKALSVIMASVVAIAFLCFLDACAAILLKPYPVQQLLPFEPYSVIRYKTTEFDCTVSINNLGFRDRDFKIAKTTRYRIVTLGDSFTFGWGVEQNEAWPKLLEKNLRNSGLDVEVANLGVPSAGPGDYARYAERALPPLAPDLVIVGLTQGDDIWQVGEYKPFSPAPSHRWMILPHLLRYIRRSEKTRFMAKSTTSTWKEEAATTLRPIQHPALNRLGRTIRENFVKGKMNPAVVVIPLMLPSYFMDYLAPDDAHTIQNTNYMAAQLTTIATTAWHSDGTTIVVSIPYRFYVSAEDLRMAHALGFTTRETMLTTNTMDIPLERASAAAQLEFHSFTKSFRKACKSRHYYYKYDGHFNRDGHLLFADLLTPIVKDTLKNRGSKSRPMTQKRRAKI
jgi:hypothetical protein